MRCEGRQKRLEKPVRQWAHLCNTAASASSSTYTASLPCFPPATRGAASEDSRMCMSRACARESPACEHASGIIRASTRDKCCISFELFPVPHLFCFKDPFLFPPQLLFKSLLPRHPGCAWLDDSTKVSVLLSTLLSTMVSSFLIGRHVESHHLQHNIPCASICSRCSTASLCSRCSTASLGSILSNLGRATWAAWVQFACERRGARCRAEMNM